MKRFFKNNWDILKKSFISWNRNDSYARSATISYYALFSFPSLLVIVVTIAGKFFGEEAIQGKVTDKLGEYIGSEVSRDVENILVNARVQEGSIWTTIIGLGVLLFAATGVFFQLKMALNNVWNVAEKKENFLRTLINRLVSFGMILVLGLLLMISLVLSTLLNALGDVIQQLIPGIGSFLLYVFNFIISFFAITSLTAAIFKILPDVKLRWKIAFVGASVTTFFFLLGEFILGIYFEQSNPGAMYGAASSIIIILLWVYYSCLIVFFGAEFTVQYALFKNEKVVPTKNAEPAIYKELEELRNKKMQVKEEKEVIDELRSNPDKDSDAAT
ncbi:MAG TPA: YihY/virulence factor BrkB family protein [Salinimicrobium sp.]|nr:YihY/virulence factor BrkB family protein [Salinimicrobium sp.]